MKHVDRIRLIKPHVFTGEDEVFKDEPNLNETGLSDHLDDENDKSFSSLM